ncbi:MAG: tRNA (adenosine(37)-N6)-threonylcarbamoyltransferase complex dimerization subunit type 1 TsaB [Xanthobacteraceae bacterium]|nr:tRNA (adenosine(37)-N6)-threonylcarbamoyltransferase complex dimerization subunit type 1 TsaB [Xanthobacteraceae bacterium]
MRVLAIDTALDACSVAVLDTEESGRARSRSLPMARGHAEALMPLVANVMSEARTEFSELDRIAVTVGPGSFTGLRVGLAAARGIGLASGKPVVGLTTLSALAVPLIDADDSRSVLAVIDARHANVYMQLFGPGGCTVVAPRAAPLNDAIHAAMASPTRIVGNAVRLLEAAWPDNTRRPLQVSEVKAPDIIWVARLGAAADPAPASVKPLYLRAADAHPQQAGVLPRR